MCTIRWLLEQERAKERMLQQQRSEQQETVVDYKGPRVVIPMLVSLRVRR